MVDVTKLSARKLEALTEKRAEASSENCTKLIALGYGMTNGVKLRIMARDGNKDAMEYVKVQDAVQECYDEEARRKRYSGTLKPIKPSIW